MSPGNKGTGSDHNSLIHMVPGSVIGSWSWLKGRNMGNTLPEAFFTWAHPLLLQVLLVWIQLSVHRRQRLTFPPHSTLGGHILADFSGNTTLRDKDEAPGSLDTMLGAGPSSQPGRWGNLS